MEQLSEDQKSVNSADQRIICRPKKYVQIEEILDIAEIHTGPHQATTSHTEPEKCFKYAHRPTPSHNDPEKSSGCVLMINMRNTHYLVSIKHHLSMINRLSQTDDLKRTETIKVIVKKNKFFSVLQYFSTL